MEVMICSLIKVDNFIEMLFIFVLYSSYILLVQCMLNFVYLLCVAMLLSTVPQLHTHSKKEPWDPPQGEYVHAVYTIHVYRIYMYVSCACA